MRSAGGRSGTAPAAEGRTRDLRGATVTTTGYVNGVPRTQLELLHGLERVPLGSGAPRHKYRQLSYLCSKHFPAGQNLPRSPLVDVVKGGQEGWFILD